MAVFEEVAHTGRVQRLLIVPEARADEDDIASNAGPGSLSVTYEGFPGERHSGLTRPTCVRFTDIYEEGAPIRNTRQISIISEEEMALVAEGMGIDRIEPEWLGANLLISGIPDFTLLPPSSRLLFSQGLSLVIDLENEPCGYPAKQIRKVHGTKSLTFVKNAKHRRGVTAWVEQEGPLAEGDSFRVFIPKQPPWPER
ncbi:MAG: sulfurase [Rhodospirillaceae bacterium]|nr:sulfurase [Rhodospirillaceae bacterium]|tara:strand:+ start:3123 stop:3716 length:594 start_codon:yes stop_codon:yes gene_type:complete